jgi:hypothetical protein
MADKETEATKTPDFLALAGSVDVPAAKRGMPWEEVLRQTRADRARRDQGFVRREP